MSNKVLPLLMLPEGKEGKVSRINADRGLLRRLIEMGFTENVSVKIIRSVKGSLIVGVNGCRYILSKDIAMKIMVTFW